MIPHASFIILIAPSYYQVGYLSAAIHAKVLGKNQNNPDKSIYLFCNNKLVT